MLHILAAGLWLPVLGALAQPMPAAQAEKSAEVRKALSEEQLVRQRAEARLNAKVTSVTRLPFGLYEVVVGTDVLYVDAQVNYVFSGRLFDARTREDLTQKRRDELLRVDFASLPLEQAIKIVRGNGSRTLVTFEDPNCSFCRKLYQELRQVKDVTIYTFLYPILSQDSFEKSRSVWCAKDRAAAWDELMMENRSPPPAPADCKHPLQQVLALGQKLAINGTPTIIFSDGSRLPGAVPVEKVEERLRSVRR
ncbi:MAG: DsbC family protein [Burkholderiaceae bacterium]|nr:DsbC family protein [Burkholderiaceae bacterium]